MRDAMARRAIASIIATTTVLGGALALSSNGKHVVTRRDWIASGAAVPGGGAMMAGTSFFFSPEASRAAASAAASAAAVVAAYPDDLAASAATAPIAVIGASGRTGALCVASCLRRGLAVRALTRTGTWINPATDVVDDDDDDDDDDDAATRRGDPPLLSVFPCDVKETSTLAAGVSGCRGVIYAASASKKGGNAKAIDNDGVVATGNACISAGVGRYVVISSTAVTRPKSLGYIFTNAMGGIMDEKRRGEEGVIAAYSEVDPSRSSYVIIRPGGLEEPKRNVVLGAPSLELSQGDALAGVVSRADLAELAVEAAISRAPNLRDVSFELYYTDSAQPCEGRLKAYLENEKVARLHGDTYDALFEGLKHDGNYFVP